MTSSQPAMPTAEDDGPFCEAWDEDFSLHFTCTRPPGHEGDHAAHGVGDRIVHTWPRGAREGHR